MVFSQLYKSYPADLEVAWMGSFATGCSGSVMDVNAG